MNNNALIANSIRKALSEQRETMAALEKQAGEVNANIETHRIMIEGLEKSLDQYAPKTLEEKNCESSDIDTSIASVSYTNDQPALCKEYTLKILQNSKVPLHGNEIAEEYKNAGITNSNISTYGKAVRKHLEELEKEGAVYKTNPGAQRSIRFAPISKITAE